jgi:O-antigen ligase/Tfp pilus assembly protein PilF
VSAIACAYVLLSYFFNSFYDENSLCAFFTLLSLIGVVLYLQLVLYKRYIYLLYASMLLAYFIQIFISVTQGYNNNWQSLSIKAQLYNSGFYANYLAGILPLYVSLMMRKSGFGKLVRLPCFIFIFITGGLIFATFARAAIIGALIGCIFVLLAQLKLRKFIRLIVYGVIIVMVPAIACVLYNIKPASASGRLTIYNVSLNIFSDNFIFGVGANRFSSVYNNYQSCHFRTGDYSIQKQVLADNTLEAFNCILQILVEYGISGFFLFVTFAFLLVKAQNAQISSQNKIWLKAGAFGCIVTTVIAGLFSNPFHLTPLLMTTAFHLAVIIPQNSNLTVARFKFGFPFILFCFLSLTIGLYIVFHIKAERSWMKASELAKFGSFSSASKYYEKAYSVLRFNGDFLYNYGAEASVAGNYDLAIKLLERARKYNSYSNLYVFLGDAYLGLNQFAYAEKNYLHAIYIAPSHIYPKYQLVNLYKKWNKPDTARFWARKAIEFPVKVKSEISNELLNEMRMELTR